MFTRGSSHSREGSQRASNERERERLNMGSSARAVRAGCGDEGSRRDPELAKHESRCQLCVLAATRLTPAGVAAQRQCALVPAGNHANNCGATTNGKQVTFRGVFALLRRVTFERMRGARLCLAYLASLLQQASAELVVTCCKPHANAVAAGAVVCMVLQLGHLRGRPQNAAAAAYHRGLHAYNHVRGLEPRQA